MTFAMRKLRWNMPSYTAALSYFQSCTPWRGDSDLSERPLKERRVRQMGVSYNHVSGDITFRLHSTNVVIWHRDSRITLTPYPSPSTDAFANSFTPRSIFCGFNSGTVGIAAVDGGGDRQHRLYSSQADRMTFELRSEGGDNETATLVEGYVPFTRYSVDIRKANAARKASGLSDFKLWMTAVEALDGPITFKAFQASGVARWKFNERDALVGALADKKHWPNLRMAYWNDTASLYKALNRAVLKQHDCILTESIRFLTSWGQHAALVASRKNWH